MSALLPKRRRPGGLRERAIALREDERGGVSLEYVVVLILVAIIGIFAWVDYKDAVRDDASEQYQQFGYPPTEG